jgi:hypothetical protein
MTAFRGWMAGKKTYLLAGGVILVLLVLVALGRLTPETGTALLVFAACGFGVTFRAALQRHQEEEIAILKGIAQAGAALATHNVPGALRAAESIAPQGMQLVQELQQEKGS